MKRKVVSMLAIAAMLATTGCGSSTAATSTASQTSAESASVATSEAAPAEKASSATAEVATSSSEKPAINPDFDYYFLKGQPEGTKVRTILTTDGEVDDMNSLHHILLYANDIDLAGIVYSASAFHWQGDGEHTLGEIVPDNLNKEENGQELKEWRPQEMGWIERTISEQYAADYEFLSQNAEGYPTADELLSVVKVGNVEFEGDIREDTEGSDLIKAAILDDDERPLYLQSWGGFNTVARALVSIHDEYADTADWDAVYKKVCEKCVIGAHGQDKTWKNTIADMYPDLLEVMGTASPRLGYFTPYSATADVEKYYRGTWLKDNIKFNHGELMAHYNLLGDGTHYEGEIDQYQFGELMKIQWGTTEQDYDFQQYDFIAEGDSAGWIFMIPTGLRGLENPNYGTWGGRMIANGVAFNSAGEYTGDVIEEMDGEDKKVSSRWSLPFLQDWAARACWAANTYENCNHAPVVSAENLNITAKAGETVDLKGMAEDPDGDEMTTTWWVYSDASEYAGSEELSVADGSALETTFTIPADAVSDDYFNIVLTVQDNAEVPMTHYAQVIVTVE